MAFLGSSECNMVATLCSILNLLGSSKVLCGKIWFWICIHLARVKSRNGIVIHSRNILQMKREWCINEPLKNWRQKSVRPIQMISPPRSLYLLENMRKRERERERTKKERKWYQFESTSKPIAWQVYFPYKRIKIWRRKRKRGTKISKTMHCFMQGHIKTDVHFC